MLFLPAYSSGNTTSTGSSQFIAGGVVGSVIGGVAGGLFMLIGVVSVFVVLLLCRRRSMTGMHVCNIYNFTSYIIADTDHFMIVPECTEESIISMYLIVICVMQ